jgi:general stress protein 26
MAARGATSTGEMATTANDTSPSADRAATRNELRALLEGFDTVLLVTHDEDGCPRARPMALLHREHDDALWMATAAAAPKVDEIDDDSSVACVFFRDRDGAWISVSGLASLHESRERAKELWTPALEAWFRDPDDPSLLLIRVEPHHAEFYEPKGTRARRIFEKVSAARTDVSADTRPVERVDLSRLSEPMSGLERVSKI